MKYGKTQKELLTDVYNTLVKWFRHTDNTNVQKVENKIVVSSTHRMELYRVSDVTMSFIVIFDNVRINIDRTKEEYFTIEAWITNN